MQLKKKKNKYLLKLKMKLNTHVSLYNYAKYL